MSAGTPSSPTWPAGSSRSRPPVDVLQPVPQVVVFDLDDTLIVEEATARRSYRTAAEAAPAVDPDVLADAALETARELWRQSPHMQMGNELGIASWEALWATFEGGHPRLDDVAVWVPSYRRAVWEQALERCEGDISAAPKLADAYIRAQRAGHPVIPGAVELVHRIRASGRRVGLLTNGPPDIQRLKLSQLGIEDCFESVVISGEAGVGKPDPEAFTLVRSELRASAEETVMIGDSWTRDVEGAARVGMRSIWISDGRPLPRALPSVSVVATTAEAGELLGC